METSKCGGYILGNGSTSADTNRGLSQFFWKSKAYLVSVDEEDQLLSELYVSFLVSEVIFTSITDSIRAYYGILYEDMFLVGDLTHTFCLQIVSDICATSLKCESGQLIDSR